MHAHAAAHAAKALGQGDRVRVKVRIGCRARTRCESSAFTVAGLPPSPEHTCALVLTPTLSLAQGTAVVVGSACMLMLLPMLPRLWVKGAELH